MKAILCKLISSLSHFSPSVLSYLTPPSISLLSYLSLFPPLSHSLPPPDYDDYLDDDDLDLIEENLGVKVKRRVSSHFLWVRVSSPFLSGLG